MSTADRQPQSSYLLRFSARPSLSDKQPFRSSVQHQLLGFCSLDLALKSLERSLPVLAFDFPSELLLPAVINAGRLHVPYSPVIPAMADCRIRWPQACLTGIPPPHWR